MKIDCKWVSDNLEAISCETLPPERARMANVHLDTCGNCRGELEGLKEIDILVRRYVRHQLAVAHAPVRRRIAWRHVGTAAAVAASLVLAIGLGLFSETTNVTPVSDQVRVMPPPAGVAVIDKDASTPETQRAKPEEAEATADAPGEVRSIASTDNSSGPEFLITDPAGYSRTLQDYRGFVLFFGVWEPGLPEAAANIERVYRSFGSNTKLRIIGISAPDLDRAPNTTFPHFYNQNSRLMNTAPGQFTLLDQTGTIRLRGSLLDPSDDLIKVLAEALQPLPIR
jgi:hypothetical protein